MTSGMVEISIADLAQIRKDLDLERAIKKANMTRCESSTKHMANQIVELKNQVESWKNTANQYKELYENAIGTAGELGLKLDKKL